MSRVPFDLTVPPTNEEFEEIRERIKQQDVLKAQYAAQMEISRAWLIEVIKSDANVIRAALGLGPKTKGCDICGLVPCGCERRNDR